MRPRRGLALLALAAGLAIALYLVVSSGPPGRSGVFGANMDALFQVRQRAGVVDRALAGAADAGLGVARVAPLWELTEPLPPAHGRHRYDWRYDDFIAHGLRAHGFRWVAVLAYAPAWASDHPSQLHAAPRDPADFAAYAGALARRYRGLIAAYEVWNEEDSRYFWRPNPNAAGYARLYLSARQAIRRSDPGAPVLIGGLAGGHGGYVRDLLRQPGIQGHVDGVAIHPYGVDPASVLAQVRNDRVLLRSLGFASVPMYVTEYGWSGRRVANPAVPSFVRSIYAPASRRGSFIVQTAQDLLGSDCDVRMAIFYAWVTQQRDPAAVYQWYGVASPSGGATAVSDSIAQAAPLAPSRTGVCRGG